MQTHKRGFLHSKTCSEELTSMAEYRNFQFGWFIVCVFVIVMAFMTLGYIHQWGNNPLDIYGYVLLMTLFGFVLLSFYGLTVSVNEEFIVIRFGIGLFSKKIKLSSVTSVKAVKYQILAGYGIRFLPNGILYNVSGRHAVEVRIAGKSSVILIGTDDSENLMNAIEKHLVKYRI